MNSQFKVISLFSGCGGSSLGYQMAGGKILLAVEWDKNAVQIYKLNFPNTSIYYGDIKNLSIDEILKITKLKIGELDILDGSPPCQGFSIAGKRKFDDTRNYLYKEYIRILNGLKPKVFVMENVSGLIQGKMKLIFAEIMKELKLSGYNVKCKLMNTMYYGVPQSRKRVIFIGVRNDLGIEPSYPKPKTVPITVEEAFKNVKNKTYLIPKKEYIIKQMNTLKPGESLSKYYNKNKFYSCIRIPKDRPSMTLTSTIFYDISLWHYNEPRNITIEEAKRIASFPDDFKFIGNYKEQWARIGNSVPPLFMKAIAEHIKTEILSKIKEETE